MKYLITALILCSSIYAQTEKPCVIVARHKKTASEALVRWTEAKPFDYVEGKLPSGIKFKSEISDKMVRKIEEQGGKVVILPADYSLDSLKDARATCKAFQESK